MLLVCCASTAAFADLKPQVQGRMMRDFARLTFEWPEPTLFTAKTSGNDVILTFDRKANPNMGAVLKQLHPYILKAERKADGKTIVLTLDKPHRIRTFVSDNISGIDLLDIKGSKQPVAAPMVASAAPEKKPEKKTEKKTIKPLLAKTTPAKKPDAAKTLAMLAPAAGEEEKPAVTSTEKPEAPVVAEPEEKPAAVVTEQSETPVVAESPLANAEPIKTNETPAEPTKEAAAPAAEKPAGTETEQSSPVQAVAAPAPEATPQTPAEPAVAEAPKTAAAAPEVAPVKTTDLEGDKPALSHHSTGVSMVPIAVDRDTGETPETPPEEQEAQPAVPVEGSTVEASEDHETPEPLTTNRIVVSADSDGATLRFPLKERVAMAVFVRLNMLWIIFDKKLDFDLADFEELPQTILDKAVLLPHDDATILRIPVHDNIFASIKQQEGVMDIAVLLSGEKHTPDAVMDISISTDPPAPAHVFVPALEVGKTIEVQDPDIGDTLSITPIFTREQGIAQQRNFVEFSLLASTQGLAIAKKADATEVTILRNGLRISLPKGAHLSPEVVFDGSAGARAVPTSSAETLFPDELWALEKGKLLKPTLSALFNKTVFAPNEGARNLARLRMAQLYLRDGLVVEALGLLDNIKRTNPSYYRSAKLSAMHGAANFLLYRFNDAARDFGAAELNNNQEVAYWRDMLSDLLGNPQKKYDFLAIHDSYISKYPAVFRQRLAIVAADRAIAAKEYNTAIKVFDTLTKDSIAAPIQSYIDFLTAKISAENGQEQEAMEVWKRLADDDSNKFVKARATFASTLWQLDNNEITRDEATDRLERLRLRWHGDGLELQIVQLLGDLYYEKQDYVNAMRVWQIGVTGFKNTGPAIEMARKMEDVFVKLFNEGVADKMTPLEALALYYEYRNYTPSGSIGTQMMEKLADRLVAVDLLSTAAQLLEQQMRTQMEKTERSRVGSKLADIYLMNNQPKRAMKSLQDSVYGDNPILLRIYRNQLTAKAMMQLGRPDEALSVLGQDESVGAEKLRTMIYWNEKDWPNITSSIENIFKKRPDPSQPMTLEEGEFLLRLSLAYVFQNDVQQLQYLRDYFGPLMRFNPYKQAFDFVTAPDIRPTTRNFDDLLEALSNTRGFITNYKARLELADTGGTTAAPQP